MTLANQTWWDEEADSQDAPDPQWQQAFEEAWPLVARRLRGVLRARKVPPCDWDDYLQEVAARIITARLEFAHPEDLVPWATTAVRRLHLDQVRRSERLQRVERRLSVSSRRTPDVASSVMAKLDLDRVAEVVGSWSPFDREALLVGDGEDAGKRRGTSASYVRRHRLRASLLRAIDGVAGAVAGVRRFHLRRADQVNQLASMAVSPFALACAAFVLPLVAGPGGDDARPSPPVSVDLASASTGGASSPVDGHGATQPSRIVGSPANAHTAAAIPVPRRDEPLRWPAEYKVVVEGGGYTGGVEFENNHDHPPLACTENLVVPDQCVDLPIERIDAPIEEPW